MFIYYICRRNSRLAAAAREATATSKRLRTRLKSAKVRFDDTLKRERNMNMRSSFHHFHLYKQHPSQHYFPLFARLTTELLTFLILINKQDWKAKS